MRAIRPITLTVKPTSIKPPFGQIDRLIGTVDCKGKGTNHSLAEVDPWIFFDSAKIAAATEGFGKHPHVGMVAVTFLLEGRNEHWDSIHKSDKGFLEENGLYYVSAGKGLRHEEKILCKAHVVQLWLNTPKSSKKDDPFLTIVQADQQPVFDFNGATVRLLLGKFGEHQSIVKTHTNVFYACVTLPPNSTISFPVSNEYPRGWIYPIENDITVAGNTIAAGELGVFGEGDVLDIVSTQPTRVLIGCGTPLNEPWVKLLGANGSFILPTEEEADEAWKLHNELGDKFGEI